MTWRYILAITLSMLVTMLWLTLNPPPRPVPRQDQIPVAAPIPGPGNPAGAEAPIPDPSVPRRPPRDPKEVSVTFAERFLCTAVSSSGGSISQVYLPEYRENVKGNDPYLLLLPPRSMPSTEAKGTFALEVEDPSSPAKPTQIPLDENWDLAVEGAEGLEPRVIFTNEVRGISIKKTILLGGPELMTDEEGVAPPGHLKLRLEFTNTQTEVQPLTYRIYGAAGVDSENDQAPGSDIHFVRGTWNVRNEVIVEEEPASKLTAGRREEPNSPAWIGVSNNYFTSIFFPLGPDGLRASFIEKAFAEGYPDSRNLATLAREKYGRGPEELAPELVASLEAKAYRNVRVAFRSVKVQLAPGASVTHEYGLYAGPRDKAHLERYASLNFPGVNQYGMFGVLVKFFIALLGMLKTIAFGSWGFAIILLTLLVKVCLHPINRRSQASMQRFQKKMQKVKPQMDELKQRFGDNRMRMNQEMQKLWKEHGINPGQQMAGCLIIFLQLPIWWGLYSTLQYAIGLRQASFFYIQDLTRPDMLFSLGFKLPLVGWEYFNLLPLLYVILTIVNQRMQPKPEDPQMLAQYRMMTFMMVFFGFIFYSFPAGFMLYIMTSAFLGIIESKIIKAELARSDEAGGSGGGAAGSGSPAGGGQTALYPARSRKPDEGSAGAGARKGPWGGKR